MVMRKPSQLLLPSDSKNISSPCMTLSEEDDWVIVKKQKITILIPPLSSNEQVTYPVPSSDRMEVTRAESPKNQFELQNTQDVPRNSRQISPPPKTSSQPGKKKHPKQLVTEIGMARNAEKYSRQQGTQNALKHPRQLLIGSVDSTDGGVFLNQMMRTSNLNNKIHRAGGLHNWLGSLGLSQFIGIFRRRQVDKFQLLNLTMKKLKDMGAEAVGPRRKLMHAIDCLCQPYCFESRQSTPDFIPATHE